MLVSPDYYELAKREERRLARRFQKNRLYQTGAGSLNRVVRVTSHAVWFTTDQSKVPNQIPRLQLRKAICHFLINRTTTRKELEQFSNFSSALLGILELVFEKLVKLQRTVRGLLRLTLLGLRFFFSGMERTVGDMKLVKESGGRWVLMNFFTLRDVKSNRWKEVLQEHELGLFLDSGAFPHYQAQQKEFEKAAKEGRQPRVIPPIDVREYADFVRAHSDVIHAFLNLDVIRDADTSRRNQELLAELVGKRPVPIWHAQSPLSELEALVQDDYELIAIGGLAVKGMTPQKRREVLQQVISKYPDQNFHLLGHASQLLFEFPLFSADGTAYLNPRIFGKVWTPNGICKVTKEKSIEAMAYYMRHLSGMEDGPLQLSLLAI